MLLSSCQYKGKRDSEYFCRNYKLDCVKENIIVTFKTSKGDFDVELFGSSNPLTVSNFKKNISNNIYRNSKFYKLIEYSNTKIIRGGIVHENEEGLLFENGQVLNMRKHQAYVLKFSADENQQGIGKELTLDF